MRLKGQEIIKTRDVLNRTWEMEVCQIFTTPGSRAMGADPSTDGKWQATYYDGADPACWGEVAESREDAIRLCDKTVDKYFGPENKIVKIPT